MIVAGEPAGSGMPDPIPLAVDLDGTLVRTDCVIESLFVLARTRPLSLLKLPGWLLQGRAIFKQRLAALALPDVYLLPARAEVVTFLREQKRLGRTLILASAEDVAVAQAVEREFGLFDSVIASDGKVNLSGNHKRDRLVQLFGARGFDYLGNSAVDIPVWSAARHALLATASTRLSRRLAGATPISLVFRESVARWQDYLHALRPQHWVKNGLIFLPLLTAHRIFDSGLLSRALLGFVAFSLCASAIYLMNDLFDLPSDRRDPHKRDRVLASGRIPLGHALLMLALLFLCAFAIGVALSLAFAAILVFYSLLMAIYSMRLKDIPLLDVSVLATGYALRVEAGAVATSIATSPWLLAFCALLFLSLALIKRYSELATLESESTSNVIHVRGYLSTDKMIIAAQGIASGYLAVAVLALYTNTEMSHHWYPRHEFFWGICVLLMYWVSYLWLMATRGRIHDDPVTFALADRTSLWILAALGVFAALAL
jgi:4-hydroxybenzoate polyprenyltransferase